MSGNRVSWVWYWGLEFGVCGILAFNWVEGIEIGCDRILIEGVWRILGCQIGDLA